MKLFLTSGGLTTEILKGKFIELCKKEPAQIKVAFIDTASKVEKDLSFVNEDLGNLKKSGVTDVKVVDITDPKDSWKNILLDSEVIWMEGGNTFYLLEKLRESDLDKELKDIIKDKLYVGVSAGSIIVTPTIDIANVEPADSNDVGLTDFSALALVDFEVSPHTPNLVPLKNVKEYADKSPNLIYAYDDDVAILYLDNKVEVIGNGFCEIFNARNPLHRS